MHKFLIRLNDIALSICLLPVLLPIWSYQFLRSTMKKNSPVFIQKTYFSANRQIFKVILFSAYPQSLSLILLNIIKGELSFAGSFFTVDSQHEMIQGHNALIPGLYNQYRLNQKMGLDQAYDCTTQGSDSITYTKYLTLIIKGCISETLYSAQDLQDRNYFSLFNIRLDNVKLSTAVNWILEDSGYTKIGFFINVNSINQSFDDPVYQRILNMSDINFIDGSGMRIAAKHGGLKLKDNVNGTDLLPLLCDKLTMSSESVYLLGAEEGVAKRMAQTLCQQFPGLTVAGYHHGYFDKSDCDDIIENINYSGATILLVAFGSPYQEQFILDYQHNLNCKTALAVGGLFDFFSGDVNRAPIWIREMGFEWLFRLALEPKKKFVRYVYGNPRFLYRTLIKGPV